MKRCKIQKKVEVIDPVAQVYAKLRTYIYISKDNNTNNDCCLTTFTNEFNKKR